MTGGTRTSAACGRSALPRRRLDRTRFVSPRSGPGDPASVPAAIRSARRSRTSSIGTGLSGISPVRSRCSASPSMRRYPSCPSPTVSRATRRHARGTGAPARSSDSVATAMAARHCSSKRATSSGTSAARTQRVERRADRSPRYGRACAAVVTVHQRSHRQRLRQARREVARDLAPRGVRVGDDGGVDLVMPVKPLHAAKSRLRGAADRGVGDPGAHAALTLALAHDTVAAVLEARAVRRLLVISSDPVVAAELAAVGVEVVPDVTDGLNAALSHGAALLRAADPGAAGGRAAGRPARAQPGELDAALHDAAALFAAGTRRAFCPDAQGTGHHAAARRVRRGTRPALRRRVGGATPRVRRRSPARRRAGAASRRRHRRRPVRGRRARTRAAHPRGAGADGPLLSAPQAAGEEPAGQHSSSRVRGGERDEVAGVHAVPAGQR